MKFLSQVYTIARGSVGGITYTANQWHQLIARARTSPVQPNTPFQTGIRSAFNAAESDWETITPANRDLWDAYADTCVFQGPLGPHTVPGRQLFIGTLGLTRYMGALNPGVYALSLDPPTIAGFYNAGVIEPATYGGLTQGIAINIGVLGTEGVGIMIDRSIAFNPTRLRYKGPYISANKNLDEQLGPALFHLDIDTPGPPLGAAIFTRTRLVTMSAIPVAAVPHRLATISYLRHVVEAAP